MEEDKGEMKAAVSLFQWDKNQDMKRAEEARGDCKESLPPEALRPQVHAPAPPSDSWAGL